MEDNKFVLEVSDLHTTFKTDNGDVSAVNGVSFKLEPGKTLGIVGESGSGKSVTAYSIMQILAENGAITGGSVKYKGEDITKWNKKKWQISEENAVQSFPGSYDIAQSGIYGRLPA